MLASPFSFLETRAVLTEKTSQRYDKIIARRPPFRSGPCQATVQEEASKFNKVTRIAVEYGKRSPTRFSTSVSRQYA